MFYLTAPFSLRCWDFAQSNKPDVEWDTSKPAGDKIRVMDITRAKSLLGWEPQISLKEGIKETVEWYKHNNSSVSEIYDGFKK